MENDIQKRVEEALRDPKNLGEMTDADAVGTVGNASCGEMLRMWVKYREEKGKKVIDRATFQSFGCETAIAVASLATELIKGKTADEALAMSGEQLAGDLGPLPPMKIHCAQLVEGALHAALKKDDCQTQLESPATSTPSNQAPSLLENFTAPREKKIKVVLLPPEDAGN